MNAIIDFVMANYVLILAIAIIILLAIIGSYADKTNFGQGNKNSNNEKDKEKDTQDLSHMTLNEAVSGNQNSEIVEDNKEDKSEEEIDQSKNDNNTNVEVVEKENLDESFDKLDQEFNEILPEKNIISGDLLEQIDDLSLDKTQKLNFNDVPDLNDIELPEIKKLDSEEEDIWKF